MMRNALPSDAMPKAAPLPKAAYSKTMNGPSKAREVEKRKAAAQAAEAAANIRDLKQKYEARVVSPAVPKAPHPGADPELADIPEQPSPDPGSGSGVPAFSAEALEAMRSERAAARQAAPEASAPAALDA